MNSLLTVPRPLLAAGLAAITLGVPFGLYALLTAGQRRIRRELRRAAKENGWEYHRRWWQGNPMAFRIDGHAPSGLPWKLTSGNRNYNGPDWTTEMVLRFPTLGGETDFGIAPRGQQATRSERSPLPGGVDDRISAFSGTLAGAVKFMDNALPVPSGNADFDGRYEVLLSHDDARRPLVDASLAEQMLRWPADTLKVHSMLVWRDPYGFVLEARLPGPPDWATVSYFLSLGNEFVLRIPPARVPASPPTHLDNLIGRVLR